MTNITIFKYYSRLAIPFLVALFVVIALPDLAFAQEQPEGEGPDLNTGNLDISENPIYLRLIEIINFLSIGVSIVVAISVAVAGLQYMAARGDSNATAAAVRRLVHAATAIGMYVFGWAILNWLVPGGILN